MQDAAAPDYYDKFQCNGPECPDTCCSGWSVHIDRETYHQYRRNQHPVLAPLVKLAVKKNPSPHADNENTFGVMQMRPDGACHFLQTDRLCMIQNVLGEKALSDTCRIYPRYLNRFGPQREKALGISCPQAARLILLNPQPIQFVTAKPEPAIDGLSFTSYRFPLQSDGDPEQIAILNDMRAVIIGILQCRSLSIGARVMVLGFMLGELDQITTSPAFAHASEIVPVLQAFVAMLDHPEQLELQFTQLQGNLPRKLTVAAQLIGKFMGERTNPRFAQCLSAAAQGLGVVEGVTDLESAILKAYTQANPAHYQPYMQDRAYIFENYLVNEAIIRLFPFTRGSYLDLYREMVCNLAIIQVMLVGVAGYHQGLTDEWVLQTMQTFARKATHNRDHFDALLRSLHVGPQDSFIHTMWLLKETA
jgi:lysine-N-methylase|nr:flagellin lysine-N-methylase [Rhodoferax sp.]